MCDFTDNGECASITGDACICGQPGYRIARSEQIARDIRSWEIEIDAPDASIAASIARDIQLDPHNLAKTFDVAEIDEETNQAHKSENVTLD